MSTMIDGGVVTREPREVVVVTDAELRGADRWSSFFGHLPVHPNVWYMITDRPNRADRIVQFKIKPPCITTLGPVR